RVADELHLVLGLLDQHLEAGIPAAPIQDASFLSEVEAARRAVAGRAAQVAGTAAALAAGDFVPMPREKKRQDSEEPRLPGPASKGQGAGAVTTTASWLSSSLTLIFWVCIFLLDIVIVVGMQIFLESIGRKRTGKGGIMSQKQMASALSKAGGPTGAPIPEPSATSTQRLSVLSQEELLAHLLAEHWVKIVIGLGISVALRLPQLFLSEDGVVFHMLFTLVMVLRCMSPVMLWFRDEMGLPKKGKGATAGPTTPGSTAAPSQKHQ
ncbi:UBP19, partial [Symbiodinium natans]